MKLLIFLSALLTGLTGAMAGERPVSASAHSIEQVLAVVQKTGVARAAAPRLAQATSSSPTFEQRASHAAAKDVIALRPLEAFPAKRRL